MSLEKEAKFFLATDDAEVESRLRRRLSGALGILWAEDNAAPKMPQAQGEEPNHAEPWGSLNLLLERLHYVSSHPWRFCTARLWSASPDTTQAHAQPQ